jgi:predicted amidophosphoribosyltransferase
MPVTPPPVSEPDASALVCSGDRVGLCAACQRKTHRYGSGGSPLCQWCMAPVQEKWGPSVRYISTRG